MAKLLPEITSLLPVILINYLSFQTQRESLLHYFDEPAVDRTMMFSGKFVYTGRAGGSKWCQGWIGRLIY